MPLGFLSRTKNNMVELVGDALCGKRLVQSFATTPLVARKSISVEVFMVTTSASSPSFTARACALEPPWAWSTRMSLPELFLYWATKAALMSL